MLDNAAFVKSIDLPYKSSWRRMLHRTKGPKPPSDSVMRSDQFLRETSAADHSNRSRIDFIGALHWFPVATDGIARLSQKVSQDLKWLSLLVLQFQLTQHDRAGTIPVPNSFRLEVAQ